MIKVDSKVKTREGIFGVVTDVISNEAGIPALDIIYIAGSVFRTFRWQLTEIAEPVIIAQNLKCQGPPIKGAHDNDWFVIVVMAHTGNIDWCNLNPVGSVEVEGYKGLGTLAECKAFVNRSKTSDKYFIFKLSEWRFTNL